MLHYLGAFSSTFWENLDTFIYSFMQQMWSIYYVPCTPIANKIIAVNKENPLPSCILGSSKDHRQKSHNDYIIIIVINIIKEGAYSKGTKPWEWTREGFPKSI